MKRIVTLFWLSAGLLFNIQANSQEAFLDTPTDAYTSKTDRPRFGWSWMQQRKNRKAIRNAQKKGLPGTVVTADSAIDETTLYGDTQELPENVWTPLHQQIYNELLSGKVAAALKSVRKLKQEGGSVDVAIPHDIRKRTLHAAAFDISKKFFNGSLELSPEWPSLINELQSDN